MTQRDYDVVVWGATGFTGVLVCEYLLERYGAEGELRWAVAARNPDKLAALKSRLGAAALPTLIADSHDPASLEAMAASTRVVLTTVGPYAHHGSELVAACVRKGTDYCDLAGEVQWIRRMIDEHQADARQSGARIVHCCGFDSVPMDIGAWFLQQEAKQRSNTHCRSITLLVRSMRGGASGGTAASILNAIREARTDRATARVLTDPYGLNPPDSRRGRDGRDQRGIRYHPQARSWTAPFVMANVNTRVVRRTHALLGYPWGEDFAYHEAIATGKGLAGWFRAAVITAGLTAFVFAASFDFTRRLLERFVLPKPGEGPDRDARESGYYRLHQIGELPDGTLIRSRIAGDRDPGYGSTSKMLAECAVCLARRETDCEGGVWTPASAMAAPLIARLRSNAGLSFDIVDSR